MCSGPQPALPLRQGFSTGGPWTPKGPW